MKIDHIKTMTRIGEIVHREDHNKKLMFKLDEKITSAQMRDNRGRVYAIVVDGNIEKLGGSQAQKGIQDTFGAYFAGFAKGMSERTYCVWNFLTKNINAGKKVEVYCVWAPTVTIAIPTMTGELTKEIPVDFHTIEEAFVEEFVSVEKKYPYLNMQESGCRWADTGLLEGFEFKNGSIFSSDVVYLVE